MKFYTNVTQNGNDLLVRGFENGERFSRKVRYNPYVFFPSKAETNWKTLAGKYVDKYQFGNITEAKNFVAQQKEVYNSEFYGYTQWVYPFINDEYPGEIEYDPSLISVLTFDIETMSDKGFPDIETAEQPLTTISIRNTGKTTVFGYKEEYTGSATNFEYIKCVDEKDLMIKFIDLWRSIDPDVVTGWFIETFDIPYVVNRIKRVLGDKYARRLSPWGILKEQELNINNKTFQVYLPFGISVLDYVQLDKKFSFVNRSSYKLDEVAFDVLKEKKLDFHDRYDTLHEMYTKDFNTYVEYNARDSELIDMMEEQQNFIHQAIAMAYDAKINYNDAFTSVRMWEVIIHNHLMSKGIVMPQYQAAASDETIIGGHVKDPQKGMHKWVASLDFASLYPHLIMSYNISPETLRSNSSDLSLIDKVLNKEFDNSEIVRQNYSMTGNGALFDNRATGFLGFLMNEKYERRKTVKANMIHLKQKLQTLNKDSAEGKELKKKISVLNNLQVAIKIQMNSAYGALANKYFRFYSLILGEAITSSGQLAIKWVEKAVNKFINKVLDTDKDYIIAIDTDSVYVNLEGIVEKYCKGKSKEQKINFVDKFCHDALSKVVDKACQDLAEYTNAYEQKLNMKRECIADKAIWTSAKHYILNVWDNERVRYPEAQLKMQGIEAVKSSTPAAVRETIKKALKVIMNQDQEDLLVFLDKFKEEFFSMSFDEVAFPRGVSNLEKYKDPSSIFRKGTPIHVRGSLLFNKLLTENNLTNKYNLIQEGEKIRFCYLKTPNTIMSNVIASSSGLPKELNLERYIDYETQYQKSFIDPLKIILDVIGWKTEKTSTLEDLFG